MNFYFNFILTELKLFFVQFERKTHETYSIKQLRGFISEGKFYSKMAAHSYVNLTKYWGGGGEGGSCDLGKRDVNFPNEQPIPPARMKNFELNCVNTFVQRVYYYFRFGDVLYAGFEIFRGFSAVSKSDTRFLNT